MMVGIFEAPVIYILVLETYRKFKLIEVSRLISTHFVTPFISGITPGSITLLSGMNQ